MRLPISWLKDYVDFDDDVRGLAEKLTLSGTEVEGIETIGGTFEGVVVGEILRVEKHPNADSLTLCAVNNGSGEITVVCGAPNAKPGLKVPFAPVGVTLPNGLKLAKRKIRGIESQGMLCAEDELGISEDHAGLMVLDPGWAPGTPLAEVLGPPETVLELEITPNRPDCLSVIGLAREVAALYGTKLKWPDVSFAESETPVETLTKVDIQDPDGCPRYTARILNGVKIKPSPRWMARRLELCGIRPINNIVDITNYVMLECGQPLHAFDQALLEEGRIVVRRHKAGEKMATLDNVERALSPDMLVIADAARPVAVAGVMGGAGSEIRETTATVLLESACFKPQSIRATSRQLGLSTESSYRFERGVNIDRVEWASRRAAQLMAQLADASVAKGVIDAHPNPRREQEVMLRIERLHDLLGLQPEAALVREVLESLELPVVASSASSLTVRVPGFRSDIDRDVDLIEEFARIHGLDKLGLPAPHARIVMDADDTPVRAALKCRDHLASLGLREIINYSFLSERLLNLFDPSTASKRLVLPNPVTSDQAIMRDSLLPQMADTLGRNLARQVSEAAFFEMGRVFRLDDSGAPGEEERLAVGLMGPVGRTGIDRNRPVQPEEMFLWVKGIWESLVAALNIDDWEIREAAAPYFETGCSVRLLVRGEEVGVAGLLSRNVRREWRMSGQVALLEARTAPLLAGVFKRRTYAPLAQYPAIARDMALVVGQQITHADVLKVVKKAAPKELESIELFDIFAGDAIGAGRKSMAYSLTYRSLTRTLTDEEANNFHESVKGALRKELEVEIREG